MSDGKENYLLLRLFRTPIQVKMIEILLQHHDDYFTLSKMAKMIEASPGSISKRITYLKELGVIKFVEGSEKTRIFKLNVGNALADLLLDFYQKLNRIGVKNLKNQL